jgi:hypothetical protein
MSYTEIQKLEICLDITNKLKKYTNPQGVEINLFNDQFSFVPKLKAKFAEYIKGVSDVSGTLDFEEINKKIVYHFPVSKKRKAKFHIKLNEDV